LFAGFWKEKAGYGVRTSWLGDASPVTKRRVTGELVELKAHSFEDPSDRWEIRTLARKGEVPESQARGHVGRV